MYTHILIIYKLFLASLNVSKRVSNSILSAMLLYILIWTRLSRQSSDIDARRWLFIIFTLLCARSQEVTVAGRVAIIFTTSNRSGYRLLIKFSPKTFKRVGRQSHVSGALVEGLLSAISFILRNSSYFCFQTLISCDLENRTN